MRIEKMTEPTNLKQRFITWYFNEFCDDPLFQNMQQTTENSPWHREQNVAIHTNMVVGQYLTMSPDRWRYPTLCGALACVFHDVGKPSAMEKRFKPERGDYFAFPGHELISARLWEDWAINNIEQLQTAFGSDFGKYEIYRTSWLIEHHLPWDTKDNKKLDQLALTANAIGTDIRWDTTFINVLKSDSFGRISDDAKSKNKKVNEWCDQMSLRQLAVTTNEPPSSAPKLYMLIGCSGSGKSTFVRLGATEWLEPNQSKTIEHYSWDRLRHDWYDKDDYARAFELSTQDKQFNSKAQKHFIELVKQKNHIVVDNINASRKRRRFFIETARQHGYYIIGVTFPIALQTVLDRQSTRDDKSVPENAVRQQYMSLQQPQYGEFDTIFVNDIQK